MLRKDVKLGFAIGGILLAVVVVYVLVVPSGDKKNVSVVTDDAQNKTDGGKTDFAPTPLSSDSKTGDSQASGGGPPLNSKPGEPETANNNNAPPADPSKIDVGPNPATMPSAMGSNTSAKGSDWNKLLTEGSSSPTMMSETPTPQSKRSADAAAAPNADQPAPADAAAAPAAAGSSVPGAVTDSAIAAAQSSDKTADYAIDSSSTPATQPAETGQRTHIVQPGEMLSSIAGVVYGDSKKWKRIAAANPDINPNRLAPGTKLIIPALTHSGESSAGSTAANIDPQTQYEVQANDSLYRISMKLYGKPSYVDKIYFANKETIGADPRRLKLHMVLKLTDPPTTTNTSSH